MKKILSLLMLLVAIVTGAKAEDTTLFLWQYDGSTVYGDGSTNGEFAMTATTGTAKFATYEKKKTSAEGTIGFVTTITDDDLKPNITKGCKLGNNGAHIKISPASGNFQAGDIIYICGYNAVIVSTSDDPTSTSKITTADGGATIIDGELSLGSAKGSYDVASVVLPTNFSETDAIYISRANGTSCGIAAIKVVRPGATDDPTITAAAKASITATESGVAVTEGIDITGANLTGTTLTVTLSPAVTGLSVSLDNDVISDGAITATATLSYTATENAKGTTTLTISDGTTSKDVTVTYQAKVVSTTLATISEATTWNFSNVTYNGSGDYTLTGDDLTTEFVYTDLDLTFTDAFNSDALAFTGKYPIRSNSKKYAQEGTLHFKTSVPGTMTVKFSDTGTSASATAVKRYLVVNGEQTEYWTSRPNNGDEPYDGQLNVTTDPIAVAAGDVTITGTSAIIVTEIAFTPATTETITIPEAGVLTYVTQNPVDFSSIDGTIKAYVVTATSTTSATTAEVAAVPAGTPLLIKGAAGDYDVEIVESAEAPAANLLQVSDGTVTGGDNIYAYSKTALKFKKVAATVTIPEGKCYLEIDGNAGDALDIIFDGEATGINDVNAGAEAVAPVKVLTAKGVQIGKFNVAGQQVK